MKYRMQEGSFELPEALKDKSLNVFALNDEGRNEFNLVISRADAGGDKTAQELAQRLMAELGKALAGFQLIHRQDTTVDTHPAVELAYSWNNNGVRMTQRQTCVLVHGPKPDKPQALLITATCLEPFSPKWNDAYNGILSSFKLESPWESSLAEKSARHLFVLGAGQLYVFAQAQEAQAGVTVNDVKAQVCAFYDDDGTRLDVKWDAETQWHLERTPEAARSRKLQHELLTVHRVQGLGVLHDAFGSLNAVVAYLNREPAEKDRSPFAWGRVDA